LAPNIEGGKVGLKSIISSPKISFDVLSEYENDTPQQVGVRSNDPDAKLFDEIKTEDDYQIGQQTGVSAFRQLETLNSDQSKSFIVTDSVSKTEDVVGNRNSESTFDKKIFIRDSNGQLIPVISQNKNSGETIYDQKYAEMIFNISNNDK
jgi:hypothetical protein